MRPVVIVALLLVAAAPAVAEDLVYRGQAVEAWAEALVAEDPMRGGPAARALVEGGADAVPMLRRLWSLRDSRIVMLELRIIDEIGPDILPEIVAAAKDPDHPWHWFAAELWWRCDPGGAEVTAHLISRIVGRDHGDRAAELLADRGAEALDLLVPLLESGDDDCLLAVARAIGGIGPEAAEALPALLAAARRAEWARTGIVRAIGGLGPAAAPAVPRLVEWLRQERSLPLMEAAAEALGGVGPAAKEAIPHLERALGLPATRLRIAAAVALVKIGADPGRALGFLAGEARAEGSPGSTSWDPPSRHYPYEAIRALVDLGPVAEPTLRALAEALRTGGVPGEMDWRLEHLQDLVRTRGDRTEEKAPPSVADLADALESLWRKDRLRATEALAERGPDAAPAVPALRRRLGDRSPAVRVAAARALAAIGPASAPAIPDLVERAVSEGGPLGAAAADALAEIGEPAVEPLVSAVLALGPRARAHGVAALRRLEAATGAVGSRLAANLASGDDAVCFGSRDLLVALGPAAEPIFVIAQAARRALASIEPPRDD